MKFLLWLILLVLCWPAALLALILYPVVWLLMIPFRLVGVTVSALFELLRAIITLPTRFPSLPAIVLSDPATGTQTPPLAQVHEPTHPAAKATADTEVGLFVG